MNNEIIKAYTKMLELTNVLATQTDAKKIVLCDELRDNIFIGLIKEDFPCMPYIRRGEQFFSFRVNGTDYSVSATRLLNGLQKYENEMKHTSILSGRAIEKMLNVFESKLIPNKNIQNENVIDAKLITKQPIPKYENEEISQNLENPDKKNQNNTSKNKNDNKNTTKNKQNKKDRQVIDTTDEDEFMFTPNPKESSNTFIPPVNTKKKEVFNPNQTTNKQNKSDVNKPFDNDTSKHDNKNNPSVNQEDEIEKYKDELSKMKEERAKWEQEKREMQEKQKLEIEKINQENKKALQDKEEALQSALNEQKELTSIVNNDTMEATISNQPTPKEGEDQFSNIEEGVMPRYLEYDCEEDLVNAKLTVSWENGKAENIELSYGSTKTAHFKEETNTSRIFEIPYCSKEERIKVVIYGSVEGETLHITKSEETIDDLDETSKKREMLIYDAYNITVQDLTGQEPNEDYEMRVIPLVRVPDNTMDAKINIPILVTTKLENGKYKTIASEVDGNTSVIVDAGKHHFLVRGFYEKGKFGTIIYPRDNTAEKSHYFVDMQKLSFAPNVITSLQGHAYHKVQIDKDTIAHIHIIHLSDKNNDDGYTPIAVAIDSIYSENGEIIENSRETIVTNNLSVVQWTTVNGTYSIYGKWDMNTFNTKLEHM